MGNRAIVTTADAKVGVYLHWNGGRGSVEAFLAYCELKRYRPPSEDAAYGFARLAQVVGNFFGGTLSVGVIPYDPDDESLAELDNGVYVIDGWRIAGRVKPAHDFLEQPARAPLPQMLHSIDARQPACEQLGAFIDAPVLTTDQIVCGDEVWVYDALRKVDGRCAAGYVPATVLAMGAGELNGMEVDGVPIVDLYVDGECTGEDNINNYLLEGSYRLIRHEVALTA